VKQPSTTPYLIRAIYEWCVDNGFTPYLAVKVNERTKVPMEYVRDGEIILNVSADATRDLTIGNDVVQFSARFNGVSRELTVPVDSVSGVFAKETGQGLAFQQQPATEPAPGGLATVETTGEPEDKPTPPNGGRPKLQVVK
jgi:stringent starvation protein B